MRDYTGADIGPEDDWPDPEDLVDPEVDESFDDDSLHPDDDPDLDAEVSDIEYPDPEELDDED